MRLALARALVMSAGSEPRRSGGALRRLAGGDSPEALAAALRTEGWDAAAIEAAADGSGKSAVHFAAAFGNMQALNFLIERGADIHSKANPKGSVDGTRRFSPRKASRGSSGCGGARRSASGQPSKGSESRGTRRLSIRRRASFECDTSLKTAVASPPEKSISDSAAPVGRMAGIERR